MRLLVELHVEEDALSFGGGGCARNDAITVLIVDEPLA